MTDLLEPHVIILEQRPDGRIEYNREGYSISDFGGTLPDVGDLIVDQFLAKGSDLDQSASYTVKEVKRRYFHPQTDPKHGPRIRLIVESRQGEEEEHEAIARR